MSREVLIHGLRFRTDLRTLCSTVINDLMSNDFERVHVLFNRFFLTRLANPTKNFWWLSGNFSKKPQKH